MLGRVSRSARLREQLMKPARLFIGAGALLVAAASIAAGPAASARSAATAARAAPAASHVAINCEYSSLCAEVANPTEVFGDGLRRSRRAVRGLLLEQARARATT